MKRILAILLATALCFQMCAVFAAPAEVQPVETEENFEHLNFFDNFDFASLGLADDDAVTRADFARMIANMLGFDMMVNVYTEDPFIDVKAYDAGGFEIAYLKELGIVKGGADSLFYKDAYISIPDAATMMVRALGYNVNFTDEVAEKSFLTRMASSLGLRAGVKASANGSLTYLQVKRMLFNMITANMVEVAGVSVSDGTYSSLLGTTAETFSEIKFGLKPVFGIVRETDVAALNKFGCIDNYGKTTIGDELFNDEDSLTRDFIGKNVVAFLDSKDNVTHIYSYRNTVTEVDFVLEPKISKFVLSYIDPDKNELEEIKLDKSYSTIYNGVAARFSDIDFTGDGVLTVIDNDNDNIGDVVKVEKYSYMLVDNVNLVDAKLVDSEFNKVLTFNDNVLYDLYQADAGFLTRIKPYEVQVGAFVKYFTSLDGNYIHAYVLDTVVAGTLEKKTADYIVIDGIEYRFNDEVKADLVHRTAGFKYTFCFDENNKVVRISDHISYGSYAYGYLMATDSKPENFGAVKYMAKILSSGNEVLELVLADKVVLDGELKSAQYVMDNVLKKSGITNYQLLRYKLDANGLLKHIDTAQDADGYVSTLETPNYKDMLVRNYKKTTATYSTALTSDTLYRFFMSSAAIFMVPTTINSDSPAASYEDYEFKAVSASDVQNAPYAYDVFDIRENGAAGAVVIHSGVVIKGFESGDAFVFATDVREVYDPETMETYKVLRYFDYKALTFKEDRIHERVQIVSCPKLAALEKPVKGAVCRVKLQDNEIVLIDGSIPSDTRYNYTEGLVPARYTGGVLRTTDDRFFDLSKAVFVEYDMAKGDISSISSDVILLGAGSELSDIVDITVVRSVSPALCIIFR